jgi:DNA-binding MarR family transcriptional regulator/N-acetylglutamate synthase-like GNAT family acetyltransferase
MSEEIRTEETRPAEIENAEVDRVRRFNRFYTRQIGLLNRHYLDSGFSLAEVRILYELAHRDALTASDLIRELGIDAGYLSRVLLAFKKRGLIARKVSGRDARLSHLFLTGKGRKIFAPLQSRSTGDIRRMLDALSPENRGQLVEAMERIERVLAPAGDRPQPLLLRTHQSGDMGWVVHRHGALYAREYGFDQTFEALVAEITARFIRNFDPRRERCWIAEKDGEIVGSVFIVKSSKRTAKLRLLLVEPSARGLGLGRRLVEECVRFARDSGYRKIVLWTQSILTAARATYKKQGFELVHSQPERNFGHDLIAETWELKL